MNPDLIEPNPNPNPDLIECIDIVETCQRKTMQKSYSFNTFTCLFEDGCGKDIIKLNIGNLHCRRKKVMCKMHFLKGDVHGNIIHERPTLQQNRLVIIWRRALNEQK